MSLSLIVAMTESGVIGKENGLPWPRIKEDMKFFRQNTTGHPIIMGRKTYESIGKPLPQRTNIIISNQKDLIINDCYVYNSFTNALNFAKSLDSETFIIGGATIYKIALPFVDKILLTVVKDSYDGDTYFPFFDRSQWRETLLSETDKAKFFLLEK